MNWFNARDTHAMYCVGGRLYNTICLTPTSLRLKDLLDGQCLLFTRDEACQMIQQQDLIKVMPSALRRLYQTDPRYRRRLPAWEPREDLEPWAVSTTQRTEEAQRPSLTLRHAPGDSGQGRKVAVERLVRCTTFFSGTHDCLTHRPDCIAAEHLQMILLDEFSRIAASETIQTQIRALLKRYVLTLRLCIYSGYIRSFHDHTSKGSAPNGRPATTGAARSASSRHRAIVRQQRGRRPH
jgi:hypothetical protein